MSRGFSLWQMWQLSNQRINLTIFQCAAKIRWRLAHFRCNWTDQHLGRNENIITYQGHNTLVLGSKQNSEIFVFDGLFNRWGLCWYFSSWALFWFYFFCQHTQIKCQNRFSQVSTLCDRGELFLLQQFLGSTFCVGSLKSIFKPIFLYLIGANAIWQRMICFGIFSFWVLLLLLAHSNPSETGFP